MRAKTTAALLTLMSSVTLYGLSAAHAETALRVAATVAPVHSLVAMVTAGIVEPALIVRPGASPHDYALKPSEAGALDDADVVFWVGEGLESWMAKAVTSLAGDADVIELGEVEGIQRLDMRKTGTWAHDAHDAHDVHEEAEAASDHGHDHDHAGGVDPHLWLDPENAEVWLIAISDALRDADPANADRYAANAEAAVLEIDTVAAEIEILLKPVKEAPYVVFHDAYQYFERRFDLHPIGAISLGDADRPGPAGLMAVREAIVETGAVCIFSEPQFEPKLIETVIEGTEVKIGTLDPIGAVLQPGADLYPNLMRGLAVSLTDCLG